MAAERDRPTEDELVAFVDDVIAWSERLGGKFLDPDEQEYLTAAAVELREVQLPRLQDDLRNRDAAEFEAAGFSPAQTQFKTAVARRTMSAAEEPAATPARRGPWRPNAELVEAAIEGIKEILGSIKSLSKWIEAFSELVGLVGAGVKRASALRGVGQRMRRRFFGRWRS